MDEREEREEVTQAFYKAMNTTKEKYPDISEKLGNVGLVLLNYNTGHKIATAIFVRQSKNMNIEFHLPMLSTVPKDHFQKNLYNIFLHEFAHIVSYAHNDFTAKHGWRFKSIAYNLGLNSPTTSFLPAGKTLYRIGVPSRQDFFTGKITKQYGWVTEQWLEEHPDYRKYVIKTVRE